MSNLLLRSGVSGFAHRVLRSPAGIWVPKLDVVVPLHQNILCVLDGPKGKRLIPGHNIVTNDGDLYYAESMAAATPTNAFDSLYMSTVAWSPSPSKTSSTDDLASFIAGAEKLKTATYPKVNDGDADNTGAGTDVVTWAFSYTKGDFNDATIEGCGLTLPALTSWGGGAGDDVLLTAFDLTSFAKTADDTLKVFVNHTPTGV